MSDPNDSMFPSTTTPVRASLGRDWETREAGEETGEAGEETGEAG